MYKQANPKEMTKNHTKKTVNEKKNKFLIRSCIQSWNQPKFLRI